jgi:hypothetical protein
MDLFASIRGNDLERGGRIIQSHRLDLGFRRQGVSDVKLQPAGAETVVT